MGSARAAACSQPALCGCSTARRCASSARWPGGLSTLVLLAYPELAFYENKYLSVSLGVSVQRVCAVGRVSRLARAATACARARRLRRSGCRRWAGRTWCWRCRSRWRHSLIAARARSMPWQRVLVGFAAGRRARARADGAAQPSSSSVAPTSSRATAERSRSTSATTQHANGRWNDAGGLGQRAGRARAGRARRAAGRARRYTGRTRPRGGARVDATRDAFISEQPGAWLALEARSSGHDRQSRFVRDYDVRGENELIGAGIRSVCRSACCSVLVAWACARWLAARGALQEPSARACGVSCSCWRGN